jgi:hypothetical protein
VLPFGGSLPAAPEPGLVSDLTRAGLDDEAAIAVALQLAQASAEAAAGVSKRRHQLASGKPASCPAVAVAFHKHSLDLTCGKSFVKVSSQTRLACTASSYAGWHHICSTLVAACSSLEPWSLLR